MKTKHPLYFHLKVAMELIKRSLRMRVERSNQKNIMKVQPQGMVQADFTSTDYMDMQSYKSRIQGSISVNQQELLMKIAGVHNAEAAVLFSNGHLAATALCSALPDRFSTILYDEYCSLGLRDGILSSASAARFKFRHNSVGELEKFLERSYGQQIIVVIDSVYGITGDVAPLRLIVNLTKKHNAILVVDESHAVGIYGQHGAGVVSDLGLEQDVFARVFSCEYALGCKGGIVLGDKLLAAFLTSCSRHYHTDILLWLEELSDLDECYNLLGDGGLGFDELIAKITFFHNHNYSKSFEWSYNNSPVQLLHARSVEASRRLYHELASRGIMVIPMSSSLMFKGNEYLKICLRRKHTYQQIEELLSAIDEVSGKTAKMLARR